MKFQRGSLVTRPNSWVVAALAVLGAWLLERMGRLPDHMTYALVTCALSAVFHVSYSYVSTGLVLVRMSVVTHAVVNILKRVLVLLLLYSIGGRQATIHNFIGLAVCISGLLLFVWDKQGTEGKRRPMWLSMLVTYGFICLYLVFGTLSPQISLGAASFNNARSNNKDFAVRIPLRNTLIYEQQQAMGYKRGYLNDSRDETGQFLKQRLFHHQPERANFLSSRLHSHEDVIREAQRLHFNILGDALKKYEYAIVLDVTSVENNNVDPYAVAGELTFLKHIGLRVVYFCGGAFCNTTAFVKARAVAATYSPSKLVIMFHGGSHVPGCGQEDPALVRNALRILAGYPVITFPQSAFATARGSSSINTSTNLTITDSITNKNNVPTSASGSRSEYFQSCVQIYCCISNFTLILRDSLSYRIALDTFSKSSTLRLLLAPDMTFQIGQVPRVQHATFDVVWVKGDLSDNSANNFFHRNASLYLRLKVMPVWDKCLNNLPPQSTLECALNAATVGMTSLQQARGVITDILQAHFIATLLGIPHVLVDNKFQELSAYHNTWTRGLKSARLTDNPDKATPLILSLLKG